MVEDVTPEDVTLERVVLEALDAMAGTLPDGFVLHVSQLCFQHRRLRDHLVSMDAISDMQCSLLKLTMLVLDRERKTTARLRGILKRRERDAPFRRHLRSGRNY